MWEIGPQPVFDFSIVLCGMRNYWALACPIFWQIRFFRWLDAAGQDAILPFGAADLMNAGREVLNRDDVMDGIAEMLPEVQVEMTTPSAGKNQTSRSTKPLRSGPSQTAPSCRTRKYWMALKGKLTQVKSSVCR